MCQSRVGSKAILPCNFRPSLAMQVLPCMCVCMFGTYLSALVGDAGEGLGF